jgi:ParB-like nuclease domain
MTDIQMVVTKKMSPALVAKLVSVEGLEAHPLSLKVYGAPTASEELLRSIKEIGVVQPIVIDEDNFILAGTSRHYAAVQAGQGEIPAVLFQGSNIEREWLVLESNRQRVKTPSQVGREFNERFRLETEFAKQRMVEGSKNKGMPTVADPGAARDKAAKAVNLGRTTAERLGTITRKADEGNQRARNLLHDVDNNKISISAAFSKMENSGKFTKPGDCPVCDKAFPSMTQLLKHGRHDHKMEPGELKKMMGFGKESIATKKDTTRRVNDSDCLELTCRALVKRLEILLPVRVKDGVENVFVKDMADVLAFINKHGAKAFDVGIGNGDPTEANNEVLSLRNILLEVADVLKVYASRLPVLKYMESPLLSRTVMKQAESKAERKERLATRKSILVARKAGRDAKMATRAAKIAAQKS